MKFAERINKLQLYVFAAVAVLAMVACSKPAPTPTPTATPTATATPSATPTPTFEQARTEVVAYLKAFNGLHNDLAAAVSVIQFPADFATASDLVALNQALSQLLTALNGVAARFAGLPRSPLAPDTSAHYNQASAAYAGELQAIAELRQAISTGEQSRIGAAWARLVAAAAQESVINRDTEELMLKYNVSDAEVGYRFRGL